MKRLRSVLRMHADNYSKKTIAKTLKLSRNTVRKYITTYESMSLTIEDVETKSDQELSAIFHPPEAAKSKNTSRLDNLIAFFPYMNKEIKKTGVTREILWNEYRELHPDGYQKTQFNEYYNRWNKRVNPVMRIDHKAGENLYIDFAGKKLQVVCAETGEIKPVEVFVATLPASQYTYVEAVESQKKEDFLQALENALHFFGGVPKLIVPDNLKSAVSQANWYEPKLNEAFEDFLHHYDTAAVPARPRKPKDKAQVEGAVRIIYTTIYAQLRKQTFFDLGELNKAILKLLEAHNDRKLTGRPFSRKQLFEEIEKETLSALPTERFELREYIWTTVLQNGYVCLKSDRHYYSVPFHFIRKKVKISYGKNIVEIYHNHHCIAQHERTKSPFNYTTIENHLASTHRFMTKWNPQFFINWGASIGEDVRFFIEQLLEKKKHPEQAYRSCMGVLSMEKKVGRQRLNNACSRAAYFGTFNYKIIQTILVKGLDQLDEQEADLKLPQHQNIRGKSYYK